MVSSGKQWQSVAATVLRPPSIRQPKLGNPLPPLSRRSYATIDDAPYRAATEFFLETLRTAHSYSTGGSNFREYWQAHLPHMADMPP